MKKEDLLNGEFLKQFMNGDELNDFLQQLQKRAVEKMLEAELDGHWGYDKNQKTASSNSRNGYSNKKLKNSFGEASINVLETRKVALNLCL